MQTEKEELEEQVKTLQDKREKLKQQKKNEMMREELCEEEKSTHETLKKDVAAQRAELETG